MCNLRSQSNSDVEVAEAAIEEGDIGIVGDDVQDFTDGNFSPAPGVETVCVFPKNPSLCENDGILLLHALFSLDIICTLFLI